MENYNIPLKVVKNGGKPFWQRARAQKKAVTVAVTVGIKPARLRVCVSANALLTAAAKARQRLYRQGNLPEE